MLGSYSLLNKDNLNTDNSFRNIYAHTVHSLYVIDGSWDTDSDIDKLNALLMNLGGEILFLVQELSNEISFVCISRSYKVRALEFMDYILETYGIIRGDEKVASGKMSPVLLEARMKESNAGNIIDFFLERAECYYRNTDIVNASAYVLEKPDVLNAFKRYKKKNVPWAFVKTTDIAEPKKRIKIKSLENDTGIEVVSDENMIIMIGCLGEVYEITREKFERTYTVSDEKLDIFENLFSFIPAVEIPETDEYITIDDIARLCFPKPGNGIYAKCLDKRTKVFRKGMLDYFSGRTGDFMAIRYDDHQDIYIIQEEVFFRTYELLEN